MKRKKPIDRDMELAGIAHGSGTPKVNNLTIERMPIATFEFPPAGAGDTTQGLNITDIAAQKAATAAAYEAEQNKRYDYLMSTPIDDLRAAGYFVAKDTDYAANTGGIWRPVTDAEKATLLVSADAIPFLTISWIQLIENQRGKAGALLMKFNEPAIAKNTAGYEPGVTSTSNQTPVTTPIPAVENLPPVTVDNGVPVFTSDPLDTTNLGGAAGATQSGMTVSGGYWWLWYAIAIVAVIIYIKFIRK
jgi:hypothetical protein